MTSSRPRSPSSAPAAACCACGCGERLTGRRANALYYDERCRKRAYRARLRKRAEALGAPIHLSLKTLDAMGDTGNRRRDGHSAPSARKRPPSIRISYLKAVEAVANAAPEPLRPNHAWAERILEPLLSPSAREHLKERAA